MAEGRIEQYDIVSKKALQDIEKSIALLEKLQIEVKQVKGSKELAATTNKQAQAVQELSKVSQTYLKTTQQIKDEQAKQNAANVKKISQLKEAREQTKRLVDVEKQQLNTLEGLKAKTRNLKRERDKLNLSTEKGRQRLNEINKELAESNIKMKTLSKSTNLATKDMRKFEKQASKTKSKGKGLLSGLNSIKMGFVAIAAAIVGAVRVLGKYIEAYNIQLAGERKLITIMRQRSFATNAQIKEVLALTSAQQKLGIIGDEVQLSGAQQLATFTTQTDSLKTLIPAMNNLLAQQKGYKATASDATNIANLMGKAMQGQVGALTRVGISFNEAQAQVLKYGTEAERAATMAQVITDNVGNMNEELAKTPAGKIKQLKNAFGDVEETIGRVVQHLAAGFMPADGVENMDRIRKKIIAFANRLIDLQNETRVVGLVFGILFQAVKTQLTFMAEMFKLMFIRPIRLAIEAFHNFKNLDFKTALKVIKTDFISEGKEIIETAKNIGQGWARMFKNQTVDYKEIPHISDEIEEVILGSIQENETGTEAGKAIGANISKGVIKALEAAEISEEEIAKYVKELYDKVQKALKQAEEAASAGEDAAEGATKSLSQLLFGDDPMQLTDSVNSTLNEISRFYDEKQKIADQALSKSQSAIDETQSLLDEERKLAEEGKNNNVATLEDKLEKEKALKEKALKESEEIRKKQEQIDTLQQISALITAAANIFSAETAGKGVVGVILAIAGVAAMLASFAISKGDAKSSAGFAEGTEYLDLNGNPKGIDTIPGLFEGKEPIRLDEGERILSKKHNRMLGGRKLTNDQLVNYAMLGEQLEPMMDADLLRLQPEISRTVSLSTKEIESKLDQLIMENVLNRDLMRDRMQNIILTGKNDAYVIKGKSIELKKKYLS